MSSTTTGRSLVAGFGDLLAGWRRELILVVGLMVGAFALVALAGAHPADPTLFEPGSGRVENPCGPVGANLAWLLQAALGVGAWGVLAPMVAAVLALAGREVGSALRWIAGAFGLVAVLGLVHLLVGFGEGHPPGGWIGAWTALGLQAGLGTVGAAMALVTVALASATAVIRIRWSVYARRVVERLEAWFPRLAEALLQATHRVLALSARAVRGGAGLLVGALKAVGLRSGQALGRVSRSFGRSLAAEDGWEQQDLPSDHDAGLEALPTAQGGDTVVGNGPDLVEVQWEPTEVGEVEVVDDPSEVDDDDVLGLFPDFTPREAKVGPEISGDPTDAPPPAALERSSSAGAASSAAEASTPAQHTPPPADSAVEVHDAEFLHAQPGDDGKGMGRRGRFDLPELSLLDEVPEQQASFDEAEMRRMATTVEQKLASFKIGGKVTAVRPGPVVTIFEFEPEEGVKISSITRRSDDLAMALKATRVRIVAPIPGKGCVGIEIPSKRRLTVYLREILASKAFRGGGHALPCSLGKDVQGKPVVEDLAKMPHLLIGGTTGSGKSVGVNGMLMSLLYAKTPDEMRLLLIDPKMLEFEMYDGIPHLLHPVVTDPKGAATALQWACQEMDRRYEVLARWGTRNIRSYNKKRERETKNWTRQKARKYMSDAQWEATEEVPEPENMPYIVVVVDELADLMMASKNEVEEGIVRIAQKARACGIHLILATQRPSTDVVTGLIKTNMPTRISFQLRTGTDSRVILDQNGAEQLLGRGDMLVLPPGVGALQRCHGAFVSDEEVARVTDYLADQREPDYVEAVTDDGGPGIDLLDPDERDELYPEAVALVIQEDKASTSMLQRHLRIGYNRAARIVDAMEAAGVIGPPDGARPRDVLVDEMPTQ